MIQKSFKNENKNLFIIPTPIGNMNDITSRAIEYLTKIDLLLCEDTRLTGQLLKKLNIKIKLLPHHEHNKSENLIKIEKIFETYDNVGLVSDAGFPLISDPGFEIIGLCDRKRINVVVLPGPTSFLLPLVRSGFPIEKFTYYGFLKGSSSEKKNKMIEILNSETTSILFESKHKIVKMIEQINSIDANRMVCIGRELTKINEEYIIDNVKNILEILKDGEKRGEFVLIIEGCKKKQENYYKAVDILMELKLSKKEISSAVGKLYGVSKKEVYEYLLEYDE